MKLSSLFILLSVLGLAGLIQGWIITQKFAKPENLASIEAILAGTTIDVGTPVSGLVGEVFIVEGERVEKNQELFTIIPQSADQPEAGEEFVVRAERSGIATAISAKPGTFAQSSEELASIIDTSSEAVKVYAKLHVPPAKLVYLPDIRPGLTAAIQADYLNEGREMVAKIESVEPVYDAKAQTIGIELRLTELPAELEQFPVGLPLQATVQLEHKRPLQLFIQSVVQKVNGISPSLTFNEA